MEKIALGFKRIRFVVHVRSLEEIKIKRFLSELLKAVCRCDCSVPLFLSNYLLILCDEVADIRPTETVCVVVTLTGHPVQNTQR
jgi:hypothetical protein